jgi:hypothetical protein
LFTWVLDGDEGLASRPGRYISGKRASHYPLDKRIGESQSRSGCCEEDNFAIENWLFSQHPNAIPTELSRLLHGCSTLKNAKNQEILISEIRDIVRHIALANLTAVII